MSIGIRLPVSDARQLRYAWRATSSPNGRHSGIDYGWTQGDVDRSRRNLCAGHGRVESVTDDGGYNQGWGNRIWVQHTDRAATTYNHGKTGTARIRRGQIVEPGQLLSVQGETGKAAGIHLHFELYIDGTRVDPQPYLDGRRLPGTPVVPAAMAAATTGTTYAQRTVKNVPLNYINGRATPTTSGAVRQKLREGVTGSFDAFAHGQRITQNGVTTDLWFRGAFNHNWFWAGNFTSHSSAGMKSLGATRRSRSAHDPFDDGESVCGADLEWGHRYRIADRAGRHWRVRQRPTRLVITRL
ncbi:M23 family metallopeptidase [Microbacterium invictum]|uniref:M23ase beta-sheet core domain-containing protein n=1 Tax=Microbacterium invictum TaxID=515415 RepID=A0AA40VL56_9MICO|nr:MULTISPECIES: M23 family metallopeptidase [Microbacterium]MBB4139094.1 hypothetical protein [Microbacterium invictum]